MQIRRLFFVLLSVAFIAGLVSTAQAQDPETDQKDDLPLHSRFQEVPPEPIVLELENGLRVVLRPMPTAHRYSLVTLFDIGTKHDPPGKSGIGHLAEHLFLSAATDLAPSSDAQTLRRRYLTELATNTQDDYTLAAYAFSPAVLDEELGLLAERLNQINVVREDIDRELPRIENELIALYEDNVVLAANGLCLQKHSPMQNGGQRGGTMEDLTTITLEEIQNRLNTYYKPANATIVLIGPMHLENVQTVINEKFAGLAAGTKIEPVAETESPAGETHEVQLVSANAPNGRPMVSFTYDAPDPSDPLFPAFLMQTARLMIMSQMLQTKMPVLPVSYDPIRRPGYVQVYMEAESDEKVPEVVEQLTTFVAEQTALGINEQLIAVTSDRLGRALGTIDIPDQAWTSNPTKLAIQIGRRSQMAYDASGLLEALQQTTDEQMKEVAEKYFGEAGRTTMIVKTAPVDETADDSGDATGSETDQGDGSGEDDGGSGDG